MGLYTSEQSNIPWEQYSVLSLCVPSSAVVDICLLVNNGMDYSKGDQRVISYYI